MFVLNNYVSSFTSEYTIKESIKRIKGNAEILGLSQSDDDEKFTANMTKIRFSPILSISVSEKVEGTLVFVRMETSPVKRKLFNLFFAVLGVVFVLLAVLAFMGKLHFIIPISAFFGIFALRMAVERLWAKKGCIRAFKTVGKILGYAPEKVVIFKVKKVMN